MTQEIKLIHGTDRIKRLAQRPDVANAVRQIRTDMAEADRARTLNAGPSATRTSSSPKAPRRPDDVPVLDAHSFQIPAEYSPIPGLHGP